MHLALFFATRYLLSRSRMGAINWITGISTLAIAIVTAALVVVLSVFNGYVSLILEGTETTMPELMITPKGGNILDPKDPTLKQALEAEEIKAYSFALVSQGMLRQKESELMVEAYGVDSLYTEVVPLEQAILEGSFLAKEESESTSVVLGFALAFEGQIRLGEEGGTSSLYFPRRQGMINPLVPSSAFVSETLQPVGILEVKNEQLDRRLYLPIETLRRLLSYDEHRASHIALRLQDGVKASSYQPKLQATLGNTYQVLSREEQQPELTFLIRSERLMVYAIMLFILVLAAFNLASSLVMLIIEKHSDLQTLSALGMTRWRRASIFATTGMIISWLGCGIGILLGLGLSYLQLSTGWLRTGEGFLDLPFPITIVWSDLLWVFLTTALIALLSSGLPSLFVPTDIRSRQ